MKKTVNWLREIIKKDFILFRERHKHSICCKPITETFQSPYFFKVSVADNIFASRSDFANSYVGSNLALRYPSLEISEYSDEFGFVSREEGYIACNCLHDVFVRL